MGKPVLDPKSRKLARKMKRVLQDGDTESSGDPAPTATPAAIPENVQLQTKRERLLKKIYAKKSAPGVGSGVSSAATAKSAKSAKVAKASTVGGVPKKRKTKEIVAPATSGNNEEDNDGAAGEPTTRKMTTALERAALKVAAKQQQPMQRKTSLNLSSAARHDLFVSELNLFNQVANQPSFVSDPYGNLQAHLDATLRRLQPQTQDIGRRPEQQGQPRQQPQARPPQRRR